MKVKAILVPEICEAPYVVSADSMDDCYWGCLWACIFGSILGLCHCAPVLLRCSAHTLLGVLSVTLSVVFDTSI